MTRDDYLAELKKYLKKLPAKDYEEAMDYFTEYFDEVGPEGEGAAMKELGTPKEAAHDVLHNLLEEKVNSDEPEQQKQSFLIALLALFAAPVAIPMAIGIAGGFIGLILGILAIAASICFTIGALSFTAFLIGASLIWESFTVLLATSSSAFALGLGLGLFAIGAGLLAFLADFYIIKGSKWTLLKVIQWISQRRRKNA
ncbi:DUF1700 domain-containing protein [Streptococcus himalayensis]|uniref:DUF1700 domain-containing protein n=2 Tax=Streptococcus himalayensis TaxID=1888195 RepID=A0A917EE95_9STRE|nr:DUF1700 domain-containing protein [Streptococcus himalayensis]GGE23375.1 hypothetical protein GCM10011510_00550 [Streptococcus himalayensis]